MVRGRTSPGSTRRGSRPQSRLRDDGLPREPRRRAADAAGGREVHVLKELDRLADPRRGGQTAPLWRPERRAGYSSVRSTTPRGIRMISLSRTASRAAVSAIAVTAVAIAIAFASTAGIARAQDAARIAAAADVPAGLRDGGPEDPRRRARGRAGESVEHGVAAERRSLDHRARGPVASCSTRASSTLRRSRGTPEVKITTLGGLLEVLPHPKFADNGLLYFTYSKGGEGNLSTTALARGKLVGKEIQGPEGHLRREELEQLADELRRPHGVRQGRDAVSHGRRAPRARARAETRWSTAAKCCA